MPCDAGWEPDLYSPPSNCVVPAAVHSLLGILALSVFSVVWLTETWLLATSSQSFWAKSREAKAIILSRAISFGCFACAFGPLAYD
jgi:hypothetical protein